MDALEDIDQYLGSLTRDIYLVDDFIPWSTINERSENLSGGVSALQTLVNGGKIDAASLTAALRTSPQTLEVLKELLAAPSGVGFADRRAIPEEAPADSRSAEVLAKLFLDLHIDDLLPRGININHALRVALIGRDARRRGFRRRRSLEMQTDQILTSAVEAAAANLSEPLELVKPPNVGVGRRASLPNIRRFVMWQERPIVAIATLFEAQSGGRQTRNINALVDTQRELNTIPAALIAVVDGQGIRDSRLALRRAWEGVAAIVNLKQARDGMLAAHIERAVAARGLLSSEASLSIGELIFARLRDAPAVGVDELPLAPDLAELELARYLREHDALALELARDDDAVLLRWTRALPVSTSIQLRTRFDPGVAIGLLGSLIGGHITDVDGDGFECAYVDEFGHPALPSEFAILATDREVTSDLVTEAAHLARRIATRATVAILVVPKAGIWPESPDQAALNRTAVTNIVVIDPMALHDLAAASDARRELASRVVRQVDLTKNSPFVYNGVTPNRVYAGRQREQASIVAAIASNSVAVLGSRRIGKTSLMRRIEEALVEQGRAAYYADCEAIGDWQGLARLARRLWSVSLPDKSFEPDLVSELVQQLSRPDPPVLLLDEVDRLVDWDLSREVAGVSEAFFRQLRSLSQENRAQFIFSGERTIAERMWASDSPHFNFCQRIDLRQLDRQSTDSLLFSVLSSMAINVEQQDTASQNVWRATTGHPRMVQLIGDRVVTTLNQRIPAERDHLTNADIEAVISSVDYKREYLETYWGQANAFEREITKAVVEGEVSMAELSKNLGLALDDLRLHRAVRMLELYGVLDVDDNDSVRIRAEYFPYALELSANGSRV